MAKKRKMTSVNTGEQSDHRVQMAPDKSKGRGIGSSFAHAVGDMKQQIGEIQSEKQNFLGKKVLDISVEDAAKLVRGEQK